MVGVVEELGEKPFQICGRRREGESDMPKLLLSAYSMGKTDSKQRSFKNGKTSPLSVNFGKQKCLLCYCKVLISQSRRGKMAVLGICILRIMFTRSYS